MIGLFQKIHDINLSEIFYDFQIENHIQIRTDKISLRITFQDVPEDKFFFHYTSVATDDLSYTLTHSNSGVSTSGETYPVQSFKYYKFRADSPISNKSILGSLNAPFGDNLAQIILTDSDFKKLVTDIFRSKGFKLQVKPIEREILVLKEHGDEIYSYAYPNISETLRRIIFFMACLETNKDSVLLFDEPEANTFPFYTKYLAERIALDETNQYFFTTHNPYLLRSVVEKADKDQIQVCITYMENYETKIKVLNREELSEILDTDIFFNLDLFLKDAAHS